MCMDKIVNESRCSNRYHTKKDPQAHPKATIADLRSEITRKNREKDIWKDRWSSLPPPLKDPESKREAKMSKERNETGSLPGLPLSEGRIERQRKQHRVESQSGERRVGWHVCRWYGSKREESLTSGHVFTVGSSQI